MSGLDEQIGLRLKTADKRLLETVCDARGEDVSDFIRRAIRTELAKLSYYPPDVQKALGIKTLEPGGISEC